MYTPLKPRAGKPAGAPQTKSPAPRQRPADTGPAAAAQRKLGALLNGGPRVMQQKALADSISGPPTTQTGLPDRLKAGVESLSGLSMDHVNVHYNSSMPAQLDAHAYAQGSDIHLGPGQEGHLPHEAWHVVQQAQGKVAPTLHINGGVPVNDDAGLEREADRMGAKALAPASIAPDLSLIAPGHGALAAPVQGVFVRKETMSSEVWLDTATKEEFYVQKRFDNGNIALQSKTRNVVINAAGQALESNLIPSGTHNVDMEDESGDTLEKQASSSSPSSPPRMFDSTTHEGGNLHDGGAEGFAALGESMGLSKLVTNLTSLFTLEPIAQGRLGKVSGEYKYGAKAIFIKEITLGDKDRPDTRFDDQESHTVSWTLVRNGLMALAGQTIDDFLAFMQSAYADLGEFVHNPEGAALLKMTTGVRLLELLRSGGLPIDRWSALCSNLLVNYMQVYQLSSAATYKRGAALGHGEAHAMLKLREDNANISMGRASRKPSAIATSIAKLLDVQFRVDSLGVDEYAFAVHHWREMLYQVFPALMHQIGAQIMKPAMDKQLAPSFKKELGLGPADSMTVAQLLTEKDRVLAHVGDHNKQHLKTDDPRAFEATLLKQLNTAFTANIGVLPLEAGQRQQVQGTLGATAFAHVQQQYSATQLEVSHLRISDQDRPKTKYIKDQKSHTVPWTLAREAIVSFNRKPVQALLQFLREALAGLIADMINAEGMQSAKKAETIVESLGTLAYSIQGFSAGLSEAVRLYFIAYQVAQSTTYVNPREMDRALGHGEAINMRLLRRNEYLLASENMIFDPKERIVKAALGMFDAAITGDFEAKNVLRAYANAIHKLKTAFPTVMTVYGQDIVEGFLGMEVAKDTPLRALKG